MLTLGIETSGRAGAVALCQDGRCLDERPLQDTGLRHAQTLVAEIDRMCRDCGLRPEDCDAVAVGIGPGSFTGLRIGVVCAKTFAYATGCQLAAIDTFVCVAENSPQQIAELYVIGDAQRAGLYIGRYLRQPDRGFQRDNEIKIVDAESWCRTRRPSDVVSGPGLNKYEECLSSQCRLVESSAWFPRAAVVARLGEQKILSGAGDDLWGLEPFYLRKSSAEEKWEAPPPDVRFGKR